MPARKDGREEEIEEGRKEWHVLGGGIAGENEEIETKNKIYSDLGKNKNKNSNDIFTDKKREDKATGEEAVKMENL